MTLLMDDAQRARWPEHAKVEAQVGVRVIDHLMSFLNAMQTQGWRLAQQDPGTGRWGPVATTRTAIIFMYLGIDQTAWNAEEAEMLAEFRRLTQIL